MAWLAWGSEIPTPLQEMSPTRYSPLHTCACLPPNSIWSHAHSSTVSHECTQATYLPTYGNNLTSLQAGQGRGRNSQTALLTLPRICVTRLFLHCQPSPAQRGVRKVRYLSFVCTTAPLAWTCSAIYACMGHLFISTTPDGL